MTARDEREDVGPAAEYALGVLDVGERQSVERRRLADPAFEAEVRRWEAALSPMAEGMAEAAPSPELWRRIEASLPSTARRGAASSDRRSGWWHSLAFWRGATGGMAALAAACLAIALVGIGRTPEVPSVQSAPPMMVAQLAPENGPTAFIVAYDPMRKTTLVSPLTREQADRVHELWVIPADGTPRSLGVIRMDGAARYAVPLDLQPVVAAGGALAISIEPAGGSPSGAPTGPVVASGPLDRV